MQHGVIAMSICASWSAPSAVFYSLKKINKDISHLYNPFKKIIKITKIIHQFQYNSSINN